MFSRIYCCCGWFIRLICCESKILFHYWKVGLILADKFMGTGCKLHSRTSNVQILVKEWWIVQTSQGPAFQISPVESSKGKIKPWPRGEDRLCLIRQKSTEPYWVRALVGSLSTGANLVQHATANRKRMTLPYWMDLNKCGFAILWGSHSIFGWMA